MPTRKNPTIASLKRKIARLNKELGGRTAEVDELRSENGRLRAIFDSQEDQFFATKNGRKFQKRTCKWIKDLPDHILIPFSSHEEAREDYRPCGTCRA